jgi:hypothetical protein
MPSLREETMAHRGLFRPESSYYYGVGILNDRRDGRYVTGAAQVQASFINRRLCSGGMI